MSLLFVLFFVVVIPATNSLAFTQRRASALFAVDVWEGPWNPTSTFVQKYWGEKPLLVRRAFEGSFPSWDDIVALAVDYDAGFSSRLVQHTAGDLTSFSLKYGPFDDEEELEEHFQDKKLTTLLVNDVERRHADLADWMEEQFAFLPRWRMDDAQMSIARKGGGIGPHVDNYDVFLIQTSGQRQWRVGTEKLSTADEYTALVPDIPVRILQNEFDFVEYVLEPGDMLYLPPRVIHCGTAVSNQCITLSVGCRAPSAAELIARIAETVQHTATERYQDGRGSLRESSGEESLTMDVKESMKQIVLRAMQSLLEDDAEWDQLVGGVITEPIRDDDLGSGEEEEILGQDLWKLVHESQYYLKRAPGVAAATSRLPELPESGRHHDVYRLFAHGLMWESKDPKVKHLFQRIEQGLPLQSAHLTDSPELKAIVEELVERRLLRILRDNN